MLTSCNNENLEFAWLTTRVKNVSVKETGYRMGVKLGTLVKGS